MVPARGPAREIGARATEKPDLQVWEKHAELWGQGPEVGVRLRLEGSQGETSRSGYRGTGLNHGETVCGALL